MALARPNAGWRPLLERCVSNLSANWSSPNSLMLQANASHLLSGEAAESIGRYLDLVVQWNARVDLTAARSAEELVDLFVADAAILALSSDTLERWADVGTGAGAPGLTLKLLARTLEVELVEPKTKRVSFLRTVTSSLGLSGIDVRRMRSDEVADHGVDVALSRATFAPEIWLAEGARITRRAVWVLLAQGEAPARPGWQADLEVEYRWPLTSVGRRALRYVAV